MAGLLPTMHVMRWMLAIVAVIVSGLLGDHYGAKREREIVVSELREHQANLTAVEKQYEAQVAQLRTQRNIADASNLSLQKKLKQLQAQSLERESSLRLYDKIEGNDRSTGLAVDTVTRVNDENGVPQELHITVVQAREMRMRGIPI